MNKVKYVLSFLAMLILIWCLGFFIFIKHIPSVDVTPGLYADAVVVLTGGKGRVQAGLELLNLGAAPKLFISGVGSSTTLEELVTASETSIENLAILKEKIALGYFAKNTRGNARETSAWIEENKISSIILVTSDYHMARSILEFKKLLPNVEIIAYPVKYVEDENVFKKSGEFRNLFIEYNKYLAKRLLHIFNFKATNS